MKAFASHLLSATMFNSRIAVAVVLLGTMACSTRPSVPIAEITPEEGPAATSRPDGAWRAAADRDLQSYPESLALSTAPRPKQSLLSRVVSPVTKIFSSAPADSSRPRPRSELVRSEPSTAVARVAQRFADISSDAVNATVAAEVLPAKEGPAVVRAQVLLDRARFSVGVIDGRAGRNTEKAVYWFQASQRLPTTGSVDPVTLARLEQAFGSTPAIRKYALDARSASGPFAPVPRSVYDQARLRCLCYSSPLEMLAEKFHTTPEVLRVLNPGVDLTRAAAGAEIWVPGVEEQTVPEGVRVARIHVSKTGWYVHALADDGTIIYHFPTTLGSQYDPSPDGAYRVTGIARNPVFRYQPALFSDVPDSRPTAMLPPGPNSPVGVVWIALSKPHVGIHGTPHPETIGTSNSHGCVRLTNWDAERLAAVTGRGTPVEFAY